MPLFSSTMIINFHPLCFKDSLIYSIFLFRIFIVRVFFFRINFFLEIYLLQPVLYCTYMVIFSHVFYFAEFIEE